MKNRKRRIAAILAYTFAFSMTIGAIEFSVQAKEVQTQMDAADTKEQAGVDAAGTEEQTEVTATDTKEQTGVDAAGTEVQTEMNAEVKASTQAGSETDTTTSEKISLDTLVYADAQGKVYTDMALGNFTYTGTEIKPDLKIKDGDTVLAEGTDYIVTYEAATAVPAPQPGSTQSGAAGTTESAASTTAINTTPTAPSVSANLNVGSVKMVITAAAAGKYTGGKTFTFQIVPKSILDVTIDAITDRPYSGNAKTPEPVIKDGSKTLVRKVDFKRSYVNNINVGIGTVKVTGIGNYTGVRELNFTIVQKDIYYLSYSSVSSKVYEGTAITPEVAVKSAVRTLVKDADYTLSYIDNNRVGTAGIIFTGIGNYKGSKIITFTIYPKPVSLLHLQKGKKKIKVKWTKETTGTTGYQIQYAAGSNFSSVKNVFVGKNTTAKMIKKLKGKKRYYVRVRTYTSVAGLKYYSSWSNVKSVKTKK